jgi:S-DNA-T family DNA segregation ATPase FtsK/SpoIIIE
VVLAIVLHSMQFLVFLLLSPVVILATALGDRLHWRRSRRRAAATFARRAAAARAELSAALHAETEQRRRAAADPATLLRVATARGAELWERRRGDADTLLLRLGLADLPSAVQARRGAATAPAGLLRSVPLRVDLRTGPLGVAAPRAIAPAIGRWLMGQLAVLHQPADVGLAALLGDHVGDEWSWLRWLPHLGGRVAVAGEDRSRLAAELGALVDGRTAGRRGDRGPWRGPWLVALVDGVERIDELPGLASVLTYGAAVGVTAICLERRPERLPGGCSTTVEVSGETGTRLSVCGAGRVVGRPDVAEPVADRVDLVWADSVARALGPLVDAGAEGSAEPPAACRLVELLGYRPDAQTLRRAWARTEPGLSTTLGLDSSGAVRVDLARDGPHALIAGTTGSGKSELLQTLVAGLAVTHSPADVSFVLVDYKGGAAFADCARLPHVAGVVTDLDAQLTARALQSLERELRRREELLAAAGAKDIDNYRTSACSERLARLVLVVDEFAALAEELPHFVTGLVGIAQRGRSLGVHLVLATQRPGGVVSPEIRANATLRIALRVADPAESVDVIGTDAAARIDRGNPGRAVIARGGSLTPLQTARVGGAGPRVGADSAPAVVPLDEWRRPLQPDRAAVGDRTDLQLLVDAAVEAAAAEGLSAPPRPWLPPLPATLSSGALPPPPRETTLHFGLTDVPTRQTQPPAELDLDAAGCVLFAGTSRSGRTSALLTIALQAVAALGPDRLQVHVIDCASGGLDALDPLPHLGTIARGADFDVVATLLRRLDHEVGARRTRLDGDGDRPAAPRLLVLFDGWEAFCDAAEEFDGGRSVETLLGIMRGAASAGVTVVITGDRAALAPRLGGSVATKYVLRLADRADYSLAGIPPRSLPELMPPGRAIRTADATEMQVAFAGSMADRYAAVADLAARWGPRRPGAPEPIRIRPLPPRVPLQSVPAALGRFRLGVGGDAAEPVTADIFRGAGRLLVAGPARSGRSTALRTLLVEALAADLAVVVAAPGRSPLATEATRRGAVVIAPDDIAPDDTAQHRPDAERTLVLVDDSETFVDTPAGDWLAALARDAREGVAVVAAGRSDELPLTYRGVAAEVRRGRCALLLQPGPADGELVGARLPRHRRHTVAGRGLLLGDPAWGSEFATGLLPIQIAVSDADIAGPAPPGQPMCG